MRILFITTANLATNPRLYKEIKLAEDLGYETSLIAFKQGGWSDKEDEALGMALKGKRHYFSALRSAYVPWFVSTLLQRLFRWIWPLFKDYLYVSALAHNKRTYQIAKHLLSTRESQYDLIVGHTLGALYPAFIFSKKYNIPFGFDIEDYHPGEASTLNDKDEIARRKQLLSLLLPEAVYYSYASPMIGQYVGKLMHPSLFARKLLVNNCFSREEFNDPLPTNGKLKMVWFSQNVNHGRGLEWVLPMLDKFKHDIQVTLIGAVNQKFQKEHLSGRSYIEVIAPLSQQMLNRSLSNYDVGLAVELDGADLNRQLCLTNKIWAYLQAGLYILATDTPAQRLFISERPSYGLLVNQNMESVHKGLHEILKRKDQIRRESHYRYSRGREFSWQEESKKLTKVWSEVLS